MLALPLRLPTASYGGHMGHFLLSTLALMGSTPLGNSDEAAQRLWRLHGGPAVLASDGFWLGACLREWGGPPPVAAGDGSLAARCEYLSED